MQTDISERQRSIIEFIREYGTVQVNDLSAHLQVTPQTIRRDLNQLYDMELLERTHSGAVIKDSDENIGYGTRQILMADEKTAIARQAAQIISDDASMFINLGTTTERVAEFLVDRKGILVVTNNINVASTLWPFRNIDVMIAGGRIRHADGGIIGTDTEEFVDKFEPDYAIIGCSAIDGSGEFFDYDLREVRVTQAIIRQARSVILVADSMKLARRAPVRVGTLTDVDIIVTDAGMSNEFVDVCRQNNVEVKIATPSD
ncbi:MAG: DeoR/GlpR family DNA-binding transcription regulator [Gammaproteobacteria bacterium]|nr:DeoR/GlpR family DNA-binding transcription regulator [Gammaproteobacteria bacterium]